MSLRVGLLAALLFGIPAATTWQARADDDARATGVMTLDSGDTIPGTFRPSATADIVRWQGTAFTEPFEFETSSIRSIHFPPVQPPVAPLGEFAVELASGDRLTGHFRDWSEEFVQLNSPHFGLLSLRTDAIRRLHRIDGNPLLVFSNLSGLVDWKVESGEWREDGAQIWTESEGAVLTADIQLPEQAVVEFELSWSKSPNFVFALGVDSAAAGDRQRSGWRFESWRRVLAAVHEQADVADVDHIQDISGEAGKIHLIAYLDQKDGELRVFLPDGTPSGNIAWDVKADEEKRQKLRHGVQLINRHGEIRLERLRIAKWNGVLPSPADPQRARLQQTDLAAETLSGKVVSVDAETSSFILRSGDEEQTLAMTDVASIEFTPTAESEPSEASAILQDATRISGSVREIDGAEMVIQSRDITEPLRVPLDKLRSLTCSTKSDSSVSPAVNGRPGRLEIAGHSLKGRLVDGTEQPDAHCLVWHPNRSRTSSPLKPDASGRIVYREPPPPQTTTESDRLTREGVRRAVQRQREQPEPNLFAKLFLKKADEPRAVRTDSAPQNLHLRSGDVISCTVKSINEAGIAIETSVLESTTVPHDRIKAIELDPRSSLPDLQEAKKQRLLTLPRLQAASPPTHLLCATNGDFLRCRLIALTDEHLRIEIQLEEIDIPKDRVAQIIWFHPEEMETADTPISETPNSALSTSDFRHSAQVLQEGDRRVTFDPEAVEGEIIVGVNEVVGPCRFALRDVDQLVFGEEIQADVAELAYHQWRLHPAVLPRVAQDLGDGPLDSGTVSPLVGQPAPEIDLELLSGERFRLSEHKGQLVVLDFWATWCGPCMQTMPLLEEAAQEFDPAEVRFVSVNLEERADQVKGVLERHEFDVTVALDIDGVAARRYEANAIPQLVVVDREGKVARLYVGGGANVIEQLKTSLNELLAQ